MEELLFSVIFVGGVKSIISSKQWFIGRSEMYHAQNRVFNCLVCYPSPATLTGETYQDGASCLVLLTVNGTLSSSDAHIRHIYK